MAAAVTGSSLSSPKALIAEAADSPRPNTIKFSTINIPWKRCNTTQFRRMYVRPAAAVPDRISEKVEESIKRAQETCSEDPVSGECAAAWDEVEELSAAASHARARKKESDPLESYFVRLTLVTVLITILSLRSSNIRFRRCQIS